MAKQLLPTNFQDDILAQSMDGKRRYRIAQHPDGSFSFEDISVYSQKGSDFGAVHMNSTNTAVNNCADKDDVITSLSGVKTNVKPEKIAGALAVKELANDIEGDIGELAGSIKDVESEINNEVGVMNTELKQVKNTANNSWGKVNLLRWGVSDAIELRNESVHTLHITFSGFPKNEAPETVVATPYNSSGYTDELTIANITKTGFDALIRTHDGQPPHYVKVHYLAMWSE